MYLKTNVRINCLVTFLIYLHSCSSPVIVKEDNSEIAEAIVTGNIVITDHFTDNMGKELVKSSKTRYKSNQTFLHMAAKSGKADVVRYLLQKDHDIDAKDSSGYTPLHYAILNNHFDVSEILIDNGADVNIKNKAGYSSIHLATLSIPSVNKNIPSGFPFKGTITSRFGIRLSPITKNYEFHNGIDIAASSGTKIKCTADGIVIKHTWTKGLGKTVAVKHLNGHETYFGHCKKILVKKGMKIKKGDVIALVGKSGRATGSHCHYSIVYNNIFVNPYPHLYTSKKKREKYEIGKIVKLLIEKGADINARDRQGKTPLHYVILRDMNSTKLIVESGAHLNRRDKIGLTPLHYAVITDLYITKYLLRKGAKVNVKTRSKYTERNGAYYLAGSTPLQMAIKKQWLTMAKLLMRYGAE